MIWFGIVCDVFVVLGDCLSSKELELSAWKIVEEVVILAAVGRAGCVWKGRVLNG